jgi:hypothetical protein
VSEGRTMAGGRLTWRKIGLDLALARQDARKMIGN